MHRVEIPAGALVGFKAAPGADGRKLLLGTADADKDWSAIYPQVINVYAGHISHWQIHVLLNPSQPFRSPGVLFRNSVVLSSLTSFWMAVFVGVDRSRENMGAQRK